MGRLVHVGHFPGPERPPLSIVQGSQIWGGSQNFGVNSGAIPTGDIPNASVNGGVAGSGGIGTGGTTNPTGLNIFRDPQAVYNSVRRLSLSSDTRSARGVFRGLGFWQLDLSLGKSTRIAGDVRLTVSVDAINALNKVNFADPVTTSISLQNTANFGVITTQRVIALQNIFPRRLQIGARVDF